MEKLTQHIDASYFIYQTSILLFDQVYIALLVRIMLDFEYNEGAAYRIYIGI